jgi:hypothetical protein|tara:strand:- start:52 stop:576 length:525 start_codon:yes stop_codon:yes gene_type:complete
MPLTRPKNINASSITTGTLTNTNLPSGTLINSHTVDARFAEVNVTSTSYVSVHSDLTFNYTPVLTSSKIYVVGEISASPHDNAGNTATGGTWAIFLNGAEQGKQTGAHEYYLGGSGWSNPDLYFGHSIKTAIFTNTNGNALAIDIKARKYTGNNFRFNQGNQWNSLVHVYEYKT